MTTTQDLSTLSPPEVDAILADLYAARAAQVAAVASATGMVHHYAEDRGHYVGKRRVQDLTLDEARAKATEIATTKTWNAAGLADQLAKLDAARAEIARINGEISAADAEWRARGCWSRFFLVKAHGGHIHASMGCSTCYATTEFGWLPQLSGLTEADAVKAHGTILCSVCFPTAPVEWTVGKAPSADTCTGSGTDAYAPGVRPGGWTKCPTCNQQVRVTPSYAVRKHNTPKEK